MCCIFNYLVVFIFLFSINWDKEWCDSLLESVLFPFFNIPCSSFSHRLSSKIRHLYMAQIQIVFLHKSDELPFDFYLLPCLWARIGLNVIFFLYFFSHTFKSQSFALAMDSQSLPFQLICNNCSPWNLRRSNQYLHAEYMNRIMTSMFTFRCNWKRQQLMPLCSSK